MEQINLISVNTNSYLVATGQSIACFLLKDNKYTYLLKTTTVSNYMSQKLVDDVKFAISENYSIDDIADLCDNPLLARCSNATYKARKGVNYYYDWYAWELAYNRRHMNYISCFSELRRCSW